MPKKKAKEPEKKKIPWVIYPLPIVFAFLLVYGFMFSDFKQIPGPMYGGDYYFHYGIVKHIANGNMPWTCPQVQGEWAFYPWLLHLSVALIGWLTGDLLKSFVLYFPLMVVFLSGVFSYLLAREVFRDEKFAVIACLGWLGTRSFVGYIPANFTPTVTVPLFLLLLLKALNSRKKGWTAAAGVSFGLLIMSHASALPAAGFLLFVIFLYEAFIKHTKAGVDAENMRLTMSTDKEAMKKSLQEAVKVLIPVFVIGFVIGLAYWGPVLLVYHFKTLNPWNDYTQPDFKAFGGEIMADLFTRYFFNYPAALDGRIHLFIFSALTSLGLYGAARRKDAGGTFIALAFVSGIVGFMHYLITTPLFDVNYAPMRFESFMISPAGFLLSVYGAYYLYCLLNTRLQRVILLAGLCVLMLYSSAVRIDAQYKDQWTEVGRLPVGPGVTELRDWVESNTDRNAVFLSHDELSFALNGLTGRKVVVERRTHFNPYVDLDQRLADAVVILYGNDSAKSLELLRKYNVSYIYWDINYLRFASQSTPSLVRPKYREYLDAYGIRYQPYNTYLDPAFGPQYKKYDVLVVFPAKDDWQQPWSDELARHLVLRKEVLMQLQTSEGQSFTGPGYRVYEVDYSSF